MKLFQPRAAIIRLVFVLKYYVYKEITVWKEKGCEKQLCFDAFVKGEKHEIAGFPPTRHDFYDTFMFEHNRQESVQQNIPKETRCDCTT